MRLRIECTTDTVITDFAYELHRVRNLRVAEAHRVNAADVARAAVRIRFLLALGPVEGERGNVLDSARLNAPPFISITYIQMSTDEYFNCVFCAHGATYWQPNLTGIYQCALA